MMVDQKQNKGILKIDNFQLQYEDIGSEAIQVDITGQVVMKIQEKISDDLLLIFHTSINNQLTKYSNDTGHYAYDIGYCLELFCTKNYNREYHQGETEIGLTIIFKKPVDNASAFSLIPTITKISTLILGAVFILNT